ncbi:MAG: rod shape-determining protein MreC [Candidatus Pacebacteria bacterium]|nr:rod shape-determining protein MreC [Candidatus Paceibacterota bacterium]
MAEKSAPFFIFVFFRILVYNQSMNSVITKKRIIVIVCLAVCFFVINAFFGNNLKNFIYSKSEQLQASLWGRGSEDSFSRKNQEDLNKKLIEENQKLLSDLAGLQGVREENETLREALSLGLQKEFDLVLGKAISKDVLSDTILINVGLSEGVKKGFPVILSEKALLGRVVEVYPNYSRVMLITDKDNKIDVEIPDSGSFALSVGKGGLKAELDMFPKDKELKEGSLIITSAMGGNYPSGLLVGKVKNVKKLDNEVYQQAEIEKVFDLNTVNNVFVVKVAEIYND